MLPANTRACTHPHETSRGNNAANCICLCRYTYQATCHKRCLRVMTAVCQVPQQQHIQQQLAQVHCPQRRLLLLPATAAANNCSTRMGSINSCVSFCACILSRCVVASSISSSSRRDPIWHCILRSISCLLLWLSWTVITFRSRISCCVCQLAAAALVAAQPELRSLLLLLLPWLDGCTCGFWPGCPSDPACCCCCPRRAFATWHCGCCCCCGRRRCCSFAPKRNTSSWGCLWCGSWCAAEPPCTHPALPSRSSRPLW